MHTCVCCPAVLRLLSALRCASRSPWTAFMGSSCDVGTSKLFSPTRSDLGSTTQHTNRAGATLAADVAHCPQLKRPVPHSPLRVKTWRFPDRCRGIERRGEELRLGHGKEVNSRLVWSLSLHSHFSHCCREPGQR